MSANDEPADALLTRIADAYCRRVLLTAIGLVVDVEMRVPRLWHLDGDSETSIEGSASRSRVSGYLSAAIALEDFFAVAVRHLANLDRFSRVFSPVFQRDEVEVACRQQAMLGFIRRLDRHVEEASELSVGGGSQAYALKSAISMLHRDPRAEDADGLRLRRPTISQEV